MPGFYFVGLTEKSIPTGPQPRGIFVDHRRSRWQIVLSLKTFLF